MPNSCMTHTFQGFFRRYRFFFNVYLNSDSSTVQKYNYKEYRIEGPENGKPKKPKKNKNKNSNIKLLIMHIA